MNDTLSQTNTLTGTILDSTMLEQTNSSIDGWVITTTTSMHVIKNYCMIYDPKVHTNRT